MIKNWVPTVLVELVTIFDHQLCRCGAGGKACDRDQLRLYSKVDFCSYLTAFLRPEHVLVEVDLVGHLAVGAGGAEAGRAHVAAVTAVDAVAVARL